MKKWLGNLKISKKLTFGFLFITILGMIISAVGVYSLTTLTNNQNSTYQQCTLGIKVSDDMKVNLVNANMSLRDLYIYYYNPERSQYIDSINSSFSAIDKLMTDYEKTFASDQDRANYNAAKGPYNEYKNDVGKIIDATKAEKSNNDILTMIKDATPAANKAADAFEVISQFNSDLAASRIQSDTATTVWETWILIVITVVAVILAFTFSRVITGLIAPQMIKFAAIAKLLAVGDVDIKKVVEEKDRFWALRKDEVGMLSDSFVKVVESTARLAAQTKAIADGDLTTSVTVRSENDVIGKALEELVEKFHDLTSSIISASDQVASGAGLVSNSSMSLSEGASTQASSVQQLSASVQEIAAQTSTNAQNAQTVNELAKDIKKDAEKGNEQMKVMLRAMDDINVSSNSINKIIKVIDDIAFQTNILALNAAVEAARAGQYGKGFAVVAEEVRNLAGKSANAAKETTNLIEGSVRNVEKGTAIANETANALGTIVTKIAKAVDLIGDIATATKEQAAAIEQVNQGITSVSQVVQNTAAISEESAAASEELSSQASYLMEQTSYFIVRKSDGVHREHLPITAGAGKY